MAGGRHPPWQGKLTSGQQASPPRRLGSSAIRHGGAETQLESRLANCAQGNDVGGNLQVFKNRLSSQQVGRFFDDLSVFNNRVDGEVQVHENVSPTANTPQNVEQNRVQGNMHERPRRLVT